MNDAERSKVARGKDRRIRRRIDLGNECTEVELAIGRALNDEHSAATAIWQFVITVVTHSPTWTPVWPPVNPHAHTTFVPALEDNSFVEMLLGSIRHSDANSTDMRSCEHLIEQHTTRTVGRINRKRTHRNTKRLREGSGAR